MGTGAAAMEPSAKATHNNGPGDQGCVSYASGVRSEPTELADLKRFAMGSESEIGSVSDELSCDVAICIMPSKLLHIVLVIV